MLDQFTDAQTNLLLLYLSLALSSSFLDECPPCLDSMNVFISYAFI